MTQLHFIHDNDIQFITMKSAINSHAKCCKLPFGCWNSVPQAQPTLSGYIKHLQGELTGMPDWKLRVCELGPNGGRWTQLVVATFKEFGWPFELTYFLLGSEPEFFLTLRDAIRPLAEVPVSLNTNIRMPTHKVERLLTDVQFITINSDWLHTKTFKPPIDVFLAFDSICYLSYQRRLDVLLHVCESLSRRGVFYCNIKFDDALAFEQLTGKYGLDDMYPPLYNRVDKCVYYALNMP